MKLKRYNGSLIAACNRLINKPQPEAALIGVFCIHSTKKKSRTFRLSIHPRLVDQAGWRVGDRLNLLTTGDGDFVLVKNEKGNLLSGGEVMKSNRYQRKRYKFTLNMPIDMCPDFQAAAINVRVDEQNGVSFHIPLP